MINSKFLSALIVALFALTSIAQDNGGKVSDRNYIQPKDYGPNSHRAFLIPINDVFFPENFTIDASELIFFELDGSRSYTTDIDAKLRAGTKARFGVRYTVEKWTMNPVEAERIKSELSGVSSGDIDFSAKFVIISTKIARHYLRIDGNMMVKTAPAEDANNRYTDTMGGYGTITITGEIVKSEKVGIYGITDLGFGAIDSHKKTSAAIGGLTGQNDFFLYQARVIFVEKSLIKNLDMKLSTGIVGMKGWFGRESGDQIMNCDLQLNVCKPGGSLEGFIRAGKDLNNMSPMFLGVGATIKIGSKKKKKDSIILKKKSNNWSLY